MVDFSVGPAISTNREGICQLICTLPLANGIMANIGHIQATTSENVPPDMGAQRRP